MIELRPYQLEAVEAVERAWAGGMRRPLLAMATGLGKTICFGELIRRRNVRSLVLVHREELLQRAVQKLLLVWPGTQVGVVRAEADQHRAPVVVASVATLSRPERLRRVVDAFQVVVVDEAHHATAPTYRRLLGHFHEAMGLGVTATPERADRGSPTSMTVLTRPKPESMLWVTYGMIVP